MKTEKYSPFIFDMDFLKLIEDRQEKFLERPRESIENIIAEERKFSEGLIELGMKTRIDMLITFNEFHKQYANLIGKLMEKKMVSAESFHDNLKEVSILQTIKEFSSSAQDYQNKTKPLGEIMLSLRKSYASLLEILWTKLKRIISLAGLNPDEKHLKLPEIENNIKELERIYSLDLSLVKGILYGKLRNCIYHEKTYFEGPNSLVFTKEIDGKLKEFCRINDDELMEELLKSFTILTAFHHVEQSIIISWIEQLLKLTDSELKEVCKTGMLTESMKNKIAKT